MLEGKKDYKNELKVARGCSNVDVLPVCLDILIEKVDSIIKIKKKLITELLPSCDLQDFREVGEV